jgi:hypothetical protein
MDLIRISAALRRAEAERDLTQKLFKPLQDFHSFLQDVAREKSIIGHAARLFLDVDGPSMELDRMSKVLEKEDVEDVNISPSQLRDLAKVAKKIEDVVRKGTDLGKKVLKFYGGDSEDMEKGYDDETDVKRLSTALDLDPDAEQLLKKYMEDEEAWFDLTMMGKGNIIDQFGRHYDLMASGLMEGADLLESMEPAKAA